MVNQTRTQEIDINRNTFQSRNFQEVVNRVTTWEDEHKPFDRGFRLPLFQYVINEGEGGALIPINQQSVANMPAVRLMDHAHDQLLDRLEFPKKAFQKLPAKLNVLNVNYLIQNCYDKDVLMRVQDGNRVRGLLSMEYQPFDNLELLQALAPFIGPDAVIRWDYSDDRVLHLQVTFPRTTAEVKVGDVVQTGLHITNSEVGVRAVTIAALVYRLKCTNGMVGGGENGGFYRFRHTGDGDRLRDGIQGAIESANLTTTRLVEQFKAAVNKQIDDPATYLETLAKNKDNNMTQEAFKAALNAYLAEPDPSLYGVTNAITRAAHTNYTGEQRFEMERLGARVLSAGLRN